MALRKFSRSLSAGQVDDAFLKLELAEFVSDVPSIVTTREDAMKVGYFAVGIGPTVNPGLVRTIATTAERLGFATSGWAGWKRLGPG